MCRKRQEISRLVGIQDLKIVMYRGKGITKVVKKTEIGRLEIV